MKLSNFFKRFFLLAIPIFCNAQKVEVRYQQSFNTPMIKLDKIYNLILNDTISVYEEQVSDFKTKNDDGNYNQSTVDVDTGNKSKKNIYLNDNKNFYFIETFFGSAIKVQEDVFKNDWQILDSTKSISKFKCNLATKIFRGRKYYAWFTKEIPTAFGPWKLNGLPGLILEAYDEKKQFEIRALNISILDSKNKKYNGYILTSASQFSEKEKILSIKQLRSLIADKNEIILNRIRQQLPSGIPMPKLNDDCEECNDSLEKF